MEQKLQKLLYVLVFICTQSFSGFSQIGMGPITPDASAILDLPSTTQGFLPPRMTTAQRDAIASPAEGLFLYNLDSQCFQFYNGTEWSRCLGLTPTNSLDCASVISNGSYAVGNPLGATNFISINVIANIIEPYTISTNTVNGYSFSASGTFSNTGINTIYLMGSGTPIASQTDTFVITYATYGDICTTNINTTTVLPNCLALFNSGSTADGVYTIDPDGGGPNPAYDCYCDMTNDGGGWTLVFNHNTTGGFWANDAEANEFNVANPGLTTNKYSILSRLDELLSAAPYEFRLFYPSSSTRNHWTQTSDPRTTPTVTGYTPIAIDAASNNWGGLELSGGNTYLDGSVNSGNWWYSIGSVNSFNGGIPGPGTVVNQVQLYVR